MNSVDSHPDSESRTKGDVLVVDDSSDNLHLLAEILTENGYKVCRRLKADNRTRNIPVLFISGLAEVTDKIKGFSVGAMDYIAKPFYHEEVLARVKTHVSLSRVNRRLEEQNIRLQKEILELSGGG